MQYLRKVWVLIVSLAINTAIAEENNLLTLFPKPGISICQSTNRQLGDTSSKVELCVIGGSFSHDKYVLYIDREIIARGIDDETTNGVFGNYQDAKVSLVCMPQHEPPKVVSPETVAAFQEMMHISAEDAKKMAIAAQTVEVGR